MTTAIYGVGSMGGAILDGLVARGHEVLAVVRRADQAAEEAGDQEADEGEEDDRVIHGRSRR